jgi:pimeloyl-ACP methyl ester carboxylesterase
MSTTLAPQAPVNARSTVRPAAAKRSVARLLEPLDRIAESSRHLISKSLGQFETVGGHSSLPRYLYVGPRGGGDIIRIGIFATLHGDEPEGALALGRFLAALEAKPELAQGYALFIYPVCNPTGFEDNTRNARSGKDLNREFWQQSDQPEVRFLESEIWMQAFHGIVTLHSDDTSHGLYGFVKGAVLSEYLLEPALLEASRFLPRIHRPVIFFHGLEDTVVPPAQSERMALALEQRGVPVEIHLFPGEGHGFRSGAVQAQGLEATDAFFRRHLGLGR